MNAARQSPQVAANSVVPLSCLRTGEWGRLRSITGGRGLLARTLALGLTPGTPVLVLRAFGGPVIISVRGSRLALGRRMAERIWVEPLAGQSSLAVEPAGGHVRLAEVDRVARTGSTG